MIATTEAVVKMLCDWAFVVFAAMALGGFLLRLGIWTIEAVYKTWREFKRVYRGEDLAEEARRNSEAATVE